MRKEQRIHVTKDGQVKQGSPKEECFLKAVVISDGAIPTLGEIKQGLVDLLKT